jgi:diguanylate cyclase (GGDEF)-like protein/PAS domain S-box-containing protein
MASISLPTPVFLTAQRLNSLEPRAQMAVRGVILYALAYASMLLFEAPDLLLHLMLIAPPLAAGWFALEAAKRTQDGRSALAWRIMAFAMLPLAVGDAAMTYFQITGLTSSIDRWRGLQQLVYFPMLLAAVLVFPRGHRSRADAMRFTLDALTVLAAAFMISWHFVINPLINNPAGGKDLLLFTLYTAVDLIGLVAAVSMLFQDPGPHLRRATWWIAMGMIMQFVASSGWSALTIRFAPQIAQITDVIEVAGGLMIVLGTCVGWADAKQAVPSTKGNELRNRFSLLPFVAVMLGYGLLFVMAVRETRTITDLVVGAGVLTLLVMIRQLTAVRENIRMHMEQTVKESEARFRSLVQHSSDVFAILDQQGIIRYVSPAAERVFGAKGDMIVKRNLRDFVHEADRPTYDAHLSASLMGSSSISHIGCRMSRLDGQWMRTETVATNLLHDPNVTGIVLTIRDVTERVTLEEQLRYEALHDPLTGLGNRALFQDRVAHSLARAGRTNDDVAVLFMDLDNFKEINDSLGHAAGDAVLVQTANRLRTCLREADTAARFGGDEFAVLLEQTRGEGEVMDVAARIAAALSRPLTVDGRDVDLRASVGIARAEVEESADDVMRNADVAMYHAKSRGKACAVLYEPGMHAAVLSRLELQGDLRKAVEREELHLLYQPIVSLDTQAIIGAEALLRWNHPTRGPVGPVEFIPLAEETGLIVGIGQWVLKKACADAAAWPTPPGGVAPTVTINLSARQLIDDSFHDDVAATLKATGLSANRVVLELTESMLVGRSDSTMSLLHRLRALGVRLAIDDFGTGFSSLGYLSQYPLDVLKIDKSFVQGLDKGPNGRALASAVVALGRSLKLKVVAEGVERAEQEWDLRNLGCDYGQGFMYSRPVATAQLAKLLEVGEIDAPRPSRYTPASGAPLLPKRSATGTPVAVTPIALEPDASHSSQPALSDVIPDLPGIVTIGEREPAASAPAVAPPATAPEPAAPAPVAATAAPAKAPVTAATPAVADEALISFEEPIITSSTGDSVLSPLGMPPLGTFPASEPPRVIAPSSFEPMDGGVPIFEESFAAMARELGQPNPRPTPLAMPAIKSKASNTGQPLPPGATPLGVPVVSAKVAAPKPTTPGRPTPTIMMFPLPSTSTATPLGAAAVTSRRRTTPELLAAIPVTKPREMP